MTQTQIQDFQSLKGKRVLVVDDMEDNQALGRAFLNRAGVVVEVASNGNEAIHKAMEAGPDAILMDLHMPILDGLSATEELRGRGYRKPIIMVTADCRLGVRERAFESGVNGYLSKPMKWNDLLETLDRFCAPGGSSSQESNFH